jgi:hypothetical protein
LRTAVVVDRHRPRLLGWWPVPALAPAAAEVVFAVLVGALMGVAAGGGRARPAAAVAAVASLLWFAQVHEVAHVRRKANTVPVVLATLALAEGTGAGLDEPAARWPLVLVTVVVVQVYVSSAVQKLRHAGPRWARGAELSDALVRHHLWADRPLAWALAGRPRLCRVVATGMLVFEMTTPLVLVWPWLAVPYLMTGVLFHVGSGLIMGIHYLPYLGPSYLAIVLGGGGVLGLS